MSGMPSSSDPGDASQNGDGRDRSGKAAQAGGEQGNSWRGGGGSSLGSPPGVTLADAGDRVSSTGTGSAVSSAGTGSGVSSAGTGSRVSSAGISRDPVQSRRPKTVSFSVVSHSVDSAQGGQETGSRGAPEIRKALGNDRMEGSGSGGPNLRVRTNGSRGTEAGARGGKHSQTLSGRAWSLPVGESSSGGARREVRRIGTLPGRVEGTEDATGQASGDERQARGGVPEASSDGWRTGGDETGTSGVGSEPSGVVSGPSGGRSGPSGVSSYAWFGGVSEARMGREAIRDREALGVGAPMRDREDRVANGGRDWSEGGGGGSRGSGDGGSNVTPVAGDLGLGARDFGVGSDGSAGWSSVSSDVKVDEGVDSRLRMRRMHVEVVGARNLVGKGSGGSSNPYCILEFDGKQRRTAIQYSNLNPEWDEKFSFTFPHAAHPPRKAATCHESLEICVHSHSSRVTSRTASGTLSSSPAPATSPRLFQKWMSSSFSTRHRFLGRVRILVELYGESKGVAPAGEAQVRWYKLEKRSMWSTVRGDIALRLWYKDLEPGEAAVLSDDEAVEANGAGGSDAASSGTGVHLAPEASTSGRQVQPGLPRRKAIKEFDLVQSMDYLFVSVVKARALLAKDATGTSDPYVKVSVGPHTTRTRTVFRDLNPEWHQTFAFYAGEEGSEADPLGRITGHLELTLWDQDIVTDEFLGQVKVALAAVPYRGRLELPMPPQWLRLERRSAKSKVKGDILLAVWFGTQADSAFATSWQSDTGGVPGFAAKVYLAPRLWYLRVAVLRAENLLIADKGHTDAVVRVKIGSTQRAKTSLVTTSCNPVWQEDLFVVVTEPFDGSVTVEVADFDPFQEGQFLGQVVVPLLAVMARSDMKQPLLPRWYLLEGSEKRRTVRGRLQLSICLESGYHVADEAGPRASCTRATEQRLWRPPVALLELGIVGARNLVPMRTSTGRSQLTSTMCSAYCVAKMGRRWIRSRTIPDDSHPRWNEQYSWDVTEPSTVLVVGVFDSRIVRGASADRPLGKVHIRLSTLEGNRTYPRCTFPLYAVTDKGAILKNGELQLALRLSYPEPAAMIKQYFKPVHPPMHYFHPIPSQAEEALRLSAVDIIAVSLGKYTPPLPREVVTEILRYDDAQFSMRRIRRNFNRLMTIVSSIRLAIQFLNAICSWKSKRITLIAHGVFVFFVLYPHFILPTLFLLLLLAAVAGYPTRPSGPPSVDIRLSGVAEADEFDDMEEESADANNPQLSLTQTPLKNLKIIRAKLDKLRGYAARVQNLLGVVAALGERIHSLVLWTDPRATTIFCVLCLVLMLVFYFVSIRLIVGVAGLYLMRHPRFRDPLPPPPANFVARLPSLDDVLL